MKRSVVIIAAVRGTQPIETSFSRKIVGLHATVDKDKQDILRYILLCHYAIKIFDHSKLEKNLGCT